MIIRSRVELLLNLGNYQNVKCIGDVSLDTSSTSDLSLAEHTAKELGLETKDCTDPLFLQEVVRQMALQDVKQQKASLDEIDESLFSAKTSR